jgi:uncharacterized membrane protein
MDGGISILGVVYLIIGVVVALRTGYGVANFGEVLSFVLAMLLWPLVLLGVNLHIAI